LSLARRRKYKHPDIEKALAVWVKNNHKKGFLPTDAAIMAQAYKFGTAINHDEFLLKLTSESWLEKFKQENGIETSKLTRASETNPPDTDSLNLNHNPEQIYGCDFPDCSRTFVRQDLCNRHRDRHTAKSPQLHKKDSMLENSFPVTDSSNRPASREASRINPSGIGSRTAQTLPPTSTSEIPEDLLAFYLLADSEKIGLY
jgi:hypothetical protein